MLPHLTKKAPLSVNRAFVVHFRTDTNVAQGQVGGRVEHIVSGQGAHFTTLDELLAFIARILTQRQKQESAP